MDAIVELIDEEIRPYHCTIKSKQLGDLIAILQNKRQAVELSLDSKLFERIFQTHEWSGKLVLDFLSNGDILRLGMANKKMRKWTNELAIWKKIYELTLMDTKACIIYHGLSPEEKLTFFDSISTQQQKWVTPLIDKISCIIDFEPPVDNSLQHLLRAQPTEGEFCFKALQDIPQTMLSELRKALIIFDPETLIRNVHLPKCTYLRLTTECVYGESDDLTFDVDWTCFPSLKYLILEPFLLHSPDHHFRFRSLPAGVHVVILPIVDDGHVATANCHIHLPEFEHVELLEFRADFGEERDSYPLTYDPPIHTMDANSPDMQNVKKLSADRVKELVESEYDF